MGGLDLDVQYILSQGFIQDFLLGGGDLPNRNHDL